MPIISCVKTDDYSQAALDRAVARHFEQLNIDRDLKSDMKVLIKPNLLTGRRPENAVTTHPALLCALIRRLRALGVTKIIVADSPGGPYIPAALKQIYAACGLSGSELIAPLLNYGTQWRGVPSRGVGAQASFNLIEPVVEADYVINVAKMKTHSMTRVSLGIKNLFGCVPGLQKPELHFANQRPDEFANMLIDLALTVAPNVTLIDGVIAMEGNGPSAGVCRRAGVTLCARDIFHQDYYAACLMGVDPDGVPMLAAARARGLIEPESIETRGDSLSPFDPPFAMPDADRLDFTGHVPRALRPAAYKLMNTAFSPRPRVRAARCVGCGKCAESCPAHIITIRDGKARIPKQGCIRCFCCQEMCPAKAIDVRRFLNF